MTKCTGCFKNWKIKSKNTDWDGFGQPEWVGPVQRVEGLVVQIS